jgi:general secretion pathway protein D
MSLRPLRLWFAAVLCSVSCVSAQTTPAPAPVATPVAAKPDDEMVPRLQTVDMTIDDALQLLEMLTKRSIIRPPQLPPGQVNLNIKGPLPKSEAILALETALTMNQIGVVTLGDKFLKVVPLVVAKTEAPQIITGSTLDLPPSGMIAVKMFQLEFLQATDFQGQVGPLLTPGMNGSIVLLPTANAMFITDTVSNLQRVETLIKELDHPNPALLKPKFYPLKFAKASDIVTRIQTVLQSQRMQQQVGLNALTTFSADDRTNQVVVVTDPRQLPFFDELVEKLDVKGDSNTRTEVLHLKAAKATELATLINNLISGQSTAAQRAGQQQRQNQALQPTVPQPATPQNAANAAATNRLARLSGTTDSTAAAEFSSMITIIADDRTNSLLVNGTADDQRLIRELVDKTDIILPQVRIEVVIADVTLDDTDATGIDALGFQVTNNKLVGLNFSSPGISISGASTSSSSTSSTTSNFATTTLGGRFFGYSLTGILGLTTTPRKGKTQILSDPSIVTSHNKKAQIFVGEQRPSISGYLNTGTTSTTVGGGYQSNVQQQKIGITLTVTPLIGDDGSVQLDIQSSVEEPLQDVVIDGNAQPHTSERTTQSYVTAKSGEIIVLGGLQKLTSSTSTSRLGPIPIIGDLLGKRSRENHRTDLIFFLRPTVLTNSETDNAEYLKRLDGMPNKEEVRSMLDPNAPATGKSGKNSGPSRNVR